MVLEPNNPFKDPKFVVILLVLIVWLLYILQHIIAKSA